jgi:hypothetical protein
VADHVWNGDATPDALRALRDAFAREGTLRALMREALIRFARASLAAPRPGAEASAPLRAQLDAHCQACHGDGPHAFPREGTPPRDLLTKMLRQVAFGQMPRAPAEIDPGARQALVRALIAEIWADEPSRREAARYFAGGMRGLRAHRGSAILGLIEARAGGHDGDASSFTFSDADRHDAVEARPSFVTTFALAALRTCRAQGYKGKALDACLARALDVEAALKSR